MNDFFWKKNSIPTRQNFVEKSKENFRKIDFFTIFSNSKYIEIMKEKRKGKERKGAGRRD